MSLPDDAWLLARMPEHVKGAHADNAVGIFRQRNSLLRAFFEAGQEWASNAPPVGANLDELEPRHDTEPAPGPEAA